MSDGLDIREMLAREVGIPFDRRSAEHDQLIGVLEAMSENLRREIRESRDTLEVVSARIDASNKLLETICNWLAVFFLLLGIAVYFAVFKRV